MVVPPAHTNILLATALFVLMHFSAMDDVAIAGMAVRYIWSTGEHVPVTIIGPSTRGDDSFHVKYLRNGHEIEHHAPLHCVLFPIQSNCDQGKVWAGSRYVHSFGTACRAQAQPCPSMGAHLTVVLPIFSVLAQGGGYENEVLETICVNGNKRHLVGAPLKQLS